MLTIDVPGGPTLNLAHAVLDFNGTLALDGELRPGVPELMAQLAQTLTVHVVTADTFGTARVTLRDLPCRVAVLPVESQDTRKRDYVAQLGAHCVACVGNGRNDRLMVRDAALGIAVIGGEGAAVETLVAADVVAPDITAALGLLIHPRRLVATLRS